MSRRVFLNPCDFFFYGHHCLLARSSVEGNIAFMVMDVEGDIEPALLREALARTMRMHPATMGRLRITPLRGRPYWKTPDDASAAREAAATAHEYEDLRGRDDWRERAERLYPKALAHCWDHRAGPQVRFEQYVLPDERTRFFFRWPHFLMDADGAMLFLAQLGRHRLEDLTNPFWTPPGPQGADERPVDVLKGLSFRQRVGLAKRGFSLHQSHRGLRLAPLVRVPARPMAQHKIINRHWSAEQARRMQDAAKATAPPGPALYARFLAACVLRALDKLFGENGVDSEAYLITMPLRVGASRPYQDLFDKRPVQGNYLVTPILCGRRERVGDRAAISDDLQHQLQEYLRNQSDLAQWSLMWAASFIHKWSYPIIFKLPLDIVEFASGYSYYGEISDPIRSLCGRQVLNLWGGGPTPTPPAINPVFSRFADKLNLCLTYDTQVVSDEQAGRYIALIEEEIFEPVGPEISAIQDV